MSCGDIAWWRSPDIVGLLERHGQAEHLVIQIDFLVQPQRDGRAEFAIPGASKTSSGKTGFADIVSLASGEIWEIKPEKLEAPAVREATQYVKKAILACSPRWRLGNSFTTNTWYGTPGVVYRLEGGGNKAELVARQGADGAVLYFWRINGEKQSVLAPGFAWALREEIVKTYFSRGQTLQPLPGSRAPNNLPPGRFKPPNFVPGACIPQLDNFLQALLKSIRTTCAPTIMENAAVAVLVETSVFNSLVGTSVVARQIGMLQVKASDPTVRLYREALAVLTGVSAAHGVIGLAVAVAVVGYVIVGLIEIVGSAIVFACEAVALTGQAALASGGLLGSIVAGLRASETLRLAVAAGAAIVVFAIPRASRADPGTPVAFDVSLPKFIVLTPERVASARVGQATIIDGAEWIVAGLATTLPG